MRIPCRFAIGSYMHTWSTAHPAMKVLFVYRNRIRQCFVFQRPTNQCHIDMPARVASSVEAGVQSRDRVTTEQLTKLWLHLGVTACHLHSRCISSKINHSLQTNACTAEQSIVPEKNSLDYLRLQGTKAVANAPDRTKIKADDALQDSSFLCMCIYML